MPKHKLTTEERAKGGRARAEKIRADKERAQEQADEAWLAMLAKALAAHEELLDSEDAAARARALRELYDRLLGRPRQSVEHVGADGKEITVRLAFDQPGS